MLFAGLLNPFAFKNPAEERDYLSLYEHRFPRAASLVAGFALAAFAAYARFDGFSSARDRLTFVRLYVVIPLLALALWTSFQPKLQRWWEWQITVSLQIAHVGVVWLMFLYEGTSPFGISTPSYILNIIVLMISAACLSPLSFRHAVPICLSAWATYAVVVLKWSRLDADIALGYIFNLGFIAFTCCIVSGWREHMFRRLYAEEMKVRNERNLLAVILSEIVPTEVALTIRQGHKVPPRAFGEVAILFADLVGFTSLSARIGPGHLVEVLDDLFTRFDEIVERHGLEKVKTIGDSYMVVGGARSERADAVVATVELGFAMIEETHRVASRTHIPLDLRVGVHVGSVIGGVIGKTRMAFDYWGDTVNLASRLESNGVAGRVQVSEAVFMRIREDCGAAEKRHLELKGKGRVEAYLLQARRDAIVAATAEAR